VEDLVNELLARLDALDASRWSSLTQTTVRITVIVLLAWLAATLLRRAIRLLRGRIEARIDDREALRRAETLTRTFRHIVTVVISLVAGMMVLSELGVSLAPILGAAGIAGVAIGFGAQSLVKDFFSGFFILFEDQIRTGDVVRIASHAGLVEEITLRHTRLRDYEGNVHYVPNGMIDSVVNMSRGFANSVMDIGVAYRENLDEVYAVMRETARVMRADAEFGPRILEDLEIAGVERWDTSSVVVRCRFKVVALEQWSVRREFLRRLKHAFDAAGIEIPYPHLTVYAGQDKAGAAPAFPLQHVEPAPGPDR
jgi:small conductance mechanosensitive channel